MANTINANLVDDIVSQAAIQAFVDALAPLNAFTVNYSEGNEKTINIPSIATDSAQAFAGDYTTNLDSTVSNVQVSIDTHQYVTVHLTDNEAADHSKVNLEQLGFQAGAALATAVFDDITSNILAANFSANEIATAGNFDSDVVVDLKNDLDVLKAPMVGRSLLLAPSHYNALLKDTSIKNAQNLGSDSGISAGFIPNLMGFKVYESTAINNAGENLVGFAVGRPDALAIGMRYLQPQAPEQYLDARPVVDAESGAVLGLRRFYRPETGIHYLALEANWGVTKGNGSGLTRLVTA